MKDLTHLSLFSGIGGLDMAAEWAGFRTVGQCEWADFPRAVLEKHWPDVPKWRDIHDLTANDFMERTGIRDLTLISGGFPCQPFSVAGKRRGKEDDRFLWPEMLRVIRELHPAWVVGENVSGLVRVALDEILSGLQEAGYEARAYSSEARNVGGLFRGERIAIVAASNDRGTPLWRDGEFQADGEAERRRDHHRGRAATPDLWKRWDVEPRPYGVADGIPHRVDQLRCYGNSVMPQQFYHIFRVIAELEERTC